MTTDHNSPNGESEAVRLAEKYRDGVFHNAGHAYHYFNQSDRMVLASMFRHGPMPEENLSCGAANQSAKLTEQPPQWLRRKGRMDSVLKYGLTYLAKELDTTHRVDMPLTSAVHVREAIAALESADAREAELRAHAERLAEALNTFLKVHVIEVDVSYVRLRSKAESALSAYNKDKEEV